VSFFDAMFNFDYITSMKYCILFLLQAFFLPSIEIVAQHEIYRNSSLPTATRVKDLLTKMTLEEKASQLNNTSPGIERLGIPAYNWWNEALHGVARAGLATSFPQPIALAATFHASALDQVGTVVSDEARAKHHQFIKENKRGLYEGLTFYSPNINIFRDPRWGRGHETFGEDPYLTGTLATAFVKAMQGNNPYYFKTICTAKHFAVHSGPEPDRHAFNVNPSRKDLWETYLPAFKTLVQEAKVYSVMCAYNRLYNEPCCSNPFLLNTLLRKKWGFTGFIATDCGAVYDMFMFHHTAADSLEGMVQAIKVGVDNFCLGYPTAIPHAVKKGLLKESEVDSAVARLLTARLKLGMFDAEEKNPYASIPYGIVNSEKHQQQALRVAHEAIVLLKNENKILPLSENKINAIAVIGPNANDSIVHLGNYEGSPAHVTTVLEGIQKNVRTPTRVLYRKGCNLTDTIGYHDMRKAAVSVAKQSDVIIFVGGISPRLEGEALQVDVAGFIGGDKTNLELPAVQTNLLKELKKIGKPIILILINGSALAVNWENKNMDSIVEAWYNGEAAGQAIADVLFGKYNPAGRLPVTFYKSITDIPAFDNYAMEGKTYRYCSKPVLYPFGYGLSYSTFRYSNLKVSDKLLSKPIQLSIDVKNTGTYDGDEVVQLYIHQQGQPAMKELKGFHRVNLKRGETKTITFTLRPTDIMHYAETIDDLDIIPGEVEVMIGSSSQNTPLKTTVALLKQ
jgi:beta-glucosidase